MKTYEVEFWPGQIHQIQANSEEEALLQVVRSEDQWPGGSESMSHGIHFQVWVREFKDSKNN